MINECSSLGKRIRYLRREKGLSIEEFALLANINRNYLSDLERGKRNPTLKILSKISIALNISISELAKGI